MDSLGKEGLAMGLFPEIVADWNAFRQVHLQYMFRVRYDSLKKASFASSNSSVTVGKSFKKKFCGLQRLRNESSRVRSAAE